MLMMLAFGGIAFRTDWITMDDYQVPHRVFEHLLTGFMCFEGDGLARDFKKGDVAHPGDPFGSVFAWLWDTERSTAISLFADLLAEARRRTPSKEDRIRLDDLIAGLRFALHHTDLSHFREYEKVEKVLREEIPKHFSGDPNI
jgi:hypothetical protein